MSTSMRRLRPLHILVAATASIAIFLFFGLSVAGAAEELDQDEPTPASVVAVVAIDTDSESTVVQVAAEPTPTPPLGIVIAAGAPADDAPDDPTIVQPPVEPGDDDAADVEIAGPPPAPASLVVHRRMCQTFVDDIAGDVDALSAACPEPFSDEVGVVPTMLLNIAGVTTPAFGGAAQAYDWDGLAPGSYYLGAEAPAGFSDEPVVHCRVDIGNSQWQRYPSTNNSITIEVTVQGATVLCDWYEVPAPTHVDVLAMSCPLAVAPEEVNLDVLSGACLTPLEGHPFRLDQFGNSEWGETAAGVVSWTGLLPEPVLIDSWQLSGFGEPVVYCAPDDGTDAFGFPLTVVDGAFDLDLGNFAGSGATCRWFAIPRPGTIAVTKWLCPAGYDLAAAGADPATDCATPFDGVSFVFSADGVLWPLATTGEDGPGHFFFSGLDPAQYTVEEQVPPGIVGHYVSCFSSVPSENPMLGPAIAVMEIPVVGGAITLDLAENETIECDWYNVPALDDGGSDIGGEESDDGSDDVDDDDQPGNQSEGDGSEIDGSVTVVRLPDTGTGRASPADRFGQSKAWLASALTFAVWAFGNAGIGQRHRPVAKARHTARPRSARPYHDA